MFTCTKARRQDKWRRPTQSGKNKSHNRHTTSQLRPLKTLSVKHVDTLKWACQHVRRRTSVENVKSKESVVSIVTHIRKEEEKVT